MPEENLPAEGRRRPARPPWLQSEEMQPRTKSLPWPQEDQADIRNRPFDPPTSYPPARTNEDIYPQRNNRLTEDRVAPDQQQTSHTHNPNHERFKIGPRPSPGQPVDSVREPRGHTSRRSDVLGGHDPAELDPHPESSAAGEAADHHRDALSHESSGFRLSTEQAALATHHNPDEAAKPQVDGAITSSPQSPTAADHIAPQHRNGLPRAAESQRPSAWGMGLPPWATPTSVIRREVRQTTFPRQGPAERPFATPADDTTEEPPPPQPSGLPPLAASLPPPPGSVLPPLWPPETTSARLPIPQGVPPPADWQQRWADCAESPHTPIPPPEANPTQAFWSPPSLDEMKVVDRRKYAPHSGWRRAVHRATRGYVNLGDSPKDRAQEHLLACIGQPLVGDFRIAVISVKGGVGKTTTTLGLGSALAMIRRDRVIAVDANPDRGTLAERVGDVSTTSTVRNLLADPNINRYADIRGHTRMATSRLEVLASEQDPAAANVFNEADYRRTIEILGQYYNVILTDCGTGIMHSAMAGVLGLAHSIVLVSAPAIDAIRSASATLDWLMQHDHSGLVRQGHVVLSASRPGSPTLRLDKAYEFFAARCRSIHFIPFDPHLAEGADVEVGLLKPATHQAYLELAGAVAENFRHLRADHRRA